MKSSYCFEYHFYPVGQGLFSTGSIRRLENPKSSFLWVYDCGSSSSGDLLDSGIKQLKQSSKDRDRIDLLILSHFDYDHISGIVRLLKEFKVGTLMLPYMPLAQRLVIAFEEGSGGVDDPLTTFYINPVEFLLAQEGPGIERILFAPPSGNAGPAYPEESPSPQEGGPDDEPKIQFDQRPPNDEEDVGSLTPAAKSRSTSVEFLQPGSRITLPTALWEFIPYNDDPVEEINGDFVRKVAAERASLLSGTSVTGRDVALKKLKQAYDDHFGSGSDERNVISLFLYSGPIYGRWTRSRLHEGSSLCREQFWRPLWPFPDMRARHFGGRRKEPSWLQCSILHSGDGYLDTNDRLQKIIAYMNARRMERIGVFQVMHHGAEANWHQGVADAIAPLFSVFSSDPERKRWKHPHAPVLRDFWRYGAVQVNKDADFTAYGCLYP